VFVTFLKNTVAVLGLAAIAPEAILTWDEESFENPATGSSDHRTFAVFREEGFEPMESTHACVALTFSDKPWVEEFGLPALTAEIGVVASDANWTLTRGGTVTLRVCVRLLKDPG
jgi:hypothetical protein